MNAREALRGKRRRLQDINSVNTDRASTLRLQNSVIKEHILSSLTTQQKQNICITFIQRRPNVFDVWPALYKCYANVLCLLGITALQISI